MDHDGLIATSCHDAAENLQLEQDQKVQVGKVLVPWGRRLYFGSQISKRKGLEYAETVGVNIKSCRLQKWRRGRNEFQNENCESFG
ncbi:hypothetical protein D0469_13865 [Peribacillus saganii]|uniref:Uncharacterized protein n=1 Tax=Peribacillus saganii TaxID=2303992 RepID=A0A372LLS8_9BACI|nr:hypothetical protein D0469_13865 [Peribacillus saganii]